MTTRDDSKEAFVDRWSRLKQEAKDQPPAEEAPDKALDPKGPAPELPPIEDLTIESDYRAFFHPKVGEDVRRAALKKLFSDPRFNVMDGLDVYIEDYSKSEPIPPAMLAGLRQAQNILQWAKEDEQQREKERRARQQQMAGDLPSPELEPPAKDPAAASGADPGAARSSLEDPVPAKR